VFQEFTLERWSAAMRRLRTLGILPSYAIPEGFSGLSPLQHYMLNTDKEWESYYLGLPLSDLRVLLRALVMCADREEQILLDLTDLEVGGYLGEDDDPVTAATEEALRLGRVCEKVLVLTEGRTDTRILTRSLQVLYPHLAEFYSFLDHETFHFGGGTGSLTNLVKGLAGIGIGNRVIALFDNDTAGELQADEVRKLKLPENFRILTLPTLKLGRRYPTLGPNGALATNINGRACSIELYLGTAALTQEDGSLVPVQWKGFDAKLKRYQGELIDKASVQQRFLRALDAGQLDTANLAGMRAVLRVVFTAFVVS